VLSSGKLITQNLELKTSSLRLHFAACSV